MPEGARGVAEGVCDRMDQHGLDEEHVGRERHPEPQQPIDDEPSSALAVVGPRGEQTRDEEEQRDQEEAEGAEPDQEQHLHDLVESRLAHGGVGPRLDQPDVAEERVHHDDERDQDDLEVVEVEQSGAHPSSCDRRDRGR